MFIQFTADYLEHTVTGSGISPNSKKVQAVQDAPVHKNGSELRTTNVCAQVIYDTEASVASTA